METINTSVSFTLLGLCCEEGKHTNATHKYNLQPTRGREEDGEVRGGAEKISERASGGGGGGGTLRRVMLVRLMYSLG